VGGGVRGGVSEWVGECARSRSLAAGVCVYPRFEESRVLFKLIAMWVIVSFHHRLAVI
jgi:hypothetical protein